MKRALYALVVLALVSLACSALSSGPSASPTSAPGKQVLFQDDFSDSNSGWPSASDADKTANYSADGRYVIEAITTQQDVWAHPGKR